MYYDDEHQPEIILIDYENAIEPDISSLSTLGQAEISEDKWGQYPFKPVCQVQWDSQLKSVLDGIAEDNPYSSIIQIGDEISALEYVNWIKGSFGQDCRPKLYDNITKSYMLWDTGAMTSCLPRQKGDKIDKKSSIADS